LYLPKEYQAKSEKRWPLILFLHGAGQRGEDIWRVADFGLPKNLLTNADFPFIVVSPQCPQGSTWSDAELLIGLVDEITAGFAVDTSRIYLTGLSMGGYGTWRLTTPGDGPDLILTIDPITTDPCDHRFESKGHDPGVKLRHLAQIRHATCTSPICRRPAAQCDLEHNTPYEAGGRTCLCNTGPKCRHDHRLKQHPRWKVDQLPDGTFRWTTPAGRTYTTEPTRYPI